MRTILIALLFALLPGIASAATDPLKTVAQQARNYAKGIQRERAMELDADERQTLQKAAELLAEQRKCGQALNLSRQTLAGRTQTGYDEWIRHAAYGYCAKRWHDAAHAAYLASQAASGKVQSFESLQLLGMSLEAHWNYSSAEALAAFELASTHGQDPELEKAIKRLRKQFAREQVLRVERHYVELDGARPALCLDFNRDMPEAEQQAYADMIRFQPAFDARFSKAGTDRVCAEGAEYGSSYQLRVLAGLASVDGMKLQKHLDYQIQVQDREPAVWFANSRYVLPPGGGVPVHAMNVNQARLALYRIAERNLLNPQIMRQFFSDMRSYEADQIRDRLGELVWQGEADLNRRRNQEAITQLPVADLAKPAPGVYVLTAQNLEEEQGGSSQLAAQWLVVSDLGITSFQGRQGMTVQIRGLVDALPLAGVGLKLYGRNNRLLAEQASDADGLARFPKAVMDGAGGNRPVMLMAYGANGDFNFFDISKSPYDLSDRGVAGRPVPGPLDAFLYTERGVYRPGETVNFSALLRNELGLAVEGLPINLRLLRPDRRVADQRLLQPEGGGAYTAALPISSSARTGSWTLQVYLDKKDQPIGSAQFLVEAIVPPRLEVDMAQLPKQALTPDVKSGFSVEARYLFGAPGADLAAGAEVRLEPDPNPFPQYKGYRFGPVDEADDAVMLPLRGVRTDAAGIARFEFSLDRLPKVERPLRARLWAEVRDVDGRAVSVADWLPVRHRPLQIGIKTPGDGGRLKENSESAFEILALDPQGKSIARGGLDYRLIREDVHYQWYQNDGRWQYKSQVRDRLLHEGKLDLDGENAARLAFQFDYGRYRLELRDTETGVLSSVRVRAGWSGADADADTPDRISLRRDKASYRPGDTARLRVRSPFAGPASLVIAGDQVISVQNLQLSEAEQDIEVPVQAGWGAGAYAMLTAYRPDGGRAGHGPRRAVGVVWLGTDPQLYQLSVDIQAPEKTLPRQRREIPVRISGQAAGESVYLTLAAVDEAVLRLTDYRTPDPLGHYFGQRRLGVGLRDLYGRLIDGHAGTPGRIRSGAGASGRKGMPDSHVEIVSLFSGVVRLDEQGRARIPLDLPDYNGKLRLTAVAWSRERLGSAETQLVVRDPVVMLASMPRFLAAGDQSRASVLLNNMEGAEGEYRLDWTLTGAVEPFGSETAKILQLQREKRAEVEIPVLADSIGNGMLELVLQGPDGSRLVKQKKIGVRAPFLPQARRQAGMLEPGASLALGPELVAGLRKQTLEASLSLDSRPDLDVPGLLRRLDLYPYGCLEQVTSRAFPLLHLQTLSQRWDYQSKTPVDQRLSGAVQRIIEKQSYNGGFFLWNPGSQPEPWLSAYAMDFLQRARAAGTEVPDYAWERGLSWLSRQVEYPQADDNEVLATQTYALYLLARQGESHLETARYLLDQAGDLLPSVLSAAQLAAALELMGDTERAKLTFALALKMLKGDEPEGDYLHDYGSTLRDRAALLQILAETGRQTQAGELLQELAVDMRDRRWLSTQEQAWMVRAAAALSGDGGPMRLSVQGAAMPPRDKPLVMTPGAESLADGLRVGNQGDAPIWYSLAVEGSPLDAPTPEKQGMEIKRRMLDLKGNALGDRPLQQGEMLVMVLEGRLLNSKERHQALIVDPLPAGLEVENTRLAHARSAGELGWMKSLTGTRYTEALDDRFVAALDLGPNRKSFRVAYLARAVSPGRFRLPPPQVEDMYKPAYRALGESAWLNIEQ